MSPARAARLSIALAAVVGASACQSLDGGVCLADRYVSPGCQSHGGPGHLSSLQLEAPGLARATQGPQASAELDATARLRWSADPAGWTHALPGPKATWLFSRNEGRLARLEPGAASPELVLVLDGGWSDVDLEIERDGSFRFAALDGFGGRLEVWRGVPGEAPALEFERTAPQLRHLDRVRWHPRLSGPSGLDLWTPFATKAWSLDPAGAELRPETVRIGLTERRYARWREGLYRLDHVSLTATGPETSLDTLAGEAEAPKRGLWIERADQRGLAPAFSMPGAGPAEAWVWSHADMRATPDGLALVAYDTVTGRTRSTLLDPEAGRELGASVSFAESNWSGLALDVDAWGDPDRASERWTLHGLSAEGIQILDPGRIDDFARDFHRLVDDAAPGHQVVVMQSGQVMWRHAGGAAQKPGKPGEVPMELDMRMNVASVSKLITAVSALVEVQAGTLDLDAAFASQLRPEPGLAFQRKLEGATLRELLTHRSFFEIDDCERDASGRSDCDELLEAGRETWRCNEEAGHACCPRRYQNGNYQVIRTLLEGLWEVRSTPTFEAMTHASWMSAIGLEGASCSPDPDSPLRYHAARGVEGWSASQALVSGGCDASGWQLNAPELGRFLRALRYRWVLDAAGTAELESCGETGWIAWDTPWRGLDIRAKNGRLTAADYRVETLAARLPRNIDVAILLNGSGRLGAADLLRRSWYGP